MLCSRVSIIVQLTVLPFIQPQATTSFVELCRRPPLFGEGTLGKTADGIPTCTVKFRVKVEANTLNRICRSAMPFTVTRSSPKPQATCTYRQTYECPPGSKEVRGQCFVVWSGPAAFERKGCGGRTKTPFTLHTIRDRDELKWVSVLFGRKYPEVWVANTALTAGPLKKVHGKQTDQIKARLAKGGMDGVKIGSGIFAKNKESDIGYLCSVNAATLAFVKKKEDEELQKQRDKEEQDRLEEEKRRQEEEERRKKEQEKQQLEDLKRQQELEEKARQELEKQMKEQEEKIRKAKEDEEKARKRAQKAKEDEEEKRKQKVQREAQEEAEEKRKKEDEEHKKRKKELDQLQEELQEQRDEEERRKKEELELAKKRAAEEKRLQELEEERKRKEKELEEKIKKVEKQERDDEVEEGKIRDEFNEKTIFEKLEIPHVPKMTPKVLRTYFWLGTVHAVGGSDEKPNFDELNEACKIFPGSYVVSREGFPSDGDLEEIVTKFENIPMRLTIGRYDSSIAACPSNRNMTLAAYQSLFRYHFYPDGQFYVLCNRKTEVTDFINTSNVTTIDRRRRREGETVSVILQHVPPKFWKKNYPKNECADMPRSTVVLTKDGYVDVPRFARLPVICISGTPIVVEKLPPCGAGARYIPEQGKCECENKEFDGKILDPDTYGSYESGMVCLSCYQKAETRSIMFILDSSGSVTTSGWKETLRFMKAIIRAMVNARVGIIIVNDYPIINLPLGYYKKEDLESAIDKIMYIAGSTKIGYALHLSRMELKNEKTDHKAIILITDGHYDTCSKACFEEDQEFFHHVLIWLTPQPEPVTTGAVGAPLSPAGTAVQSVVEAPPKPESPWKEVGSGVYQKYVTPDIKAEEQLLRFHPDKEAVKVMDDGIELVFIAVGPYLDPEEEDYEEVMANIKKNSRGKAIIGTKAYEFDNKLLKQTINRCDNMWCSRLCLIALMVTSLPIAESQSITSFVELCRNPPLFGNGTLGVSKTGAPTCTVTFQVKVKANTLNRICRAAMPFTVISSKLSPQPTCIYRQTHHCPAGSKEVHGNCFVVWNGPAKFARNGCGNRMSGMFTLHTIRDRDELKWVSVLFGRRYPEVWVGNTAQTAEPLRKVHGPQTDQIKARIAKGGMDGVVVGNGIYAKEEEPGIGYLCSTIAATLEFARNEAKRLEDEELQRQRDKEEQERLEEEKRRQEEEEKRKKEQERQQLEELKRQQELEEKARQELEKQMKEQEEKIRKAKEDEEKARIRARKAKEDEEEKRKQRVRQHLQEEAEKKRKKEEEEHKKRKKQLDQLQEELQEQRDEEERRKKEELELAKKRAAEEKRLQELEEERKRKEKELQEKIKKVEEKERADEVEEGKIRDEFNEKTIFEKLEIPHVTMMTPKVLRTYFWLGTVHAVGGTDEKPDFVELHDVCKIFPGSYVASREAFLTDNDFADIMGRFENMPMRLTIGRYESNTKPCTKNRGDLKMYRRQFRYHFFQNGQYYNILEQYWKNDYPRNECADMPRTTAVLTRNGYVDVPRFARLPVLCVFGTLPVLKKYKVCGNGAHYIVNEDRCECINKEFDGTIIDPDTYGGYEKGMVCLSCQTTKETRAVMFILDSSGSVSTTGWTETLNFMKKIIRAVENVRVGIIIVNDYPTITLPINYYNYNELQAAIDKLSYVARSTKIGYSLHLAREALNKEKTDHKAVILITDGHFDTCSEKCWGSGHSYGYTNIVLNPIPAPILPPPPLPFIFIGPFFGGGFNPIIPAGPIIPPPILHPPPLFPHVGWQPAGHGTYTHNTPGDTAEKNLLNYKQDSEASKVMNDGIELVYIAVGPFLNRWNREHNAVMANIRNVAKGKAIIGTSKYAFDNKLLKQTINRVCNRIE
ncbi:hypothetical protein Q1695_009523 [Nippostrongylus brasiliensis]|nr:hypothetical protein Q1695_009523 [Nippostrongylus brasiliensis]